MIAGIVLLLMVLYYFIPYDPFLNKMEWLVWFHEQPGQFRMKIAALLLLTTAIERVGDKISALKK